MQVVILDLVIFNNLDLAKLQDPLKIHNNKEEEEPQGESMHPYPDYLVYQVARRVITKHSLTVNGIHNLINFENFTKPGPVNETSLGY